jgi:hypothetical protein
MHTITSDSHLAGRALECPHWSGPPFGINLSRFQEDGEMTGKRDKPEDIVPKLRQVGVLQGQGNPFRRLCGRSVSRFRSIIGGAGNTEACREQLKRQKELEPENTRLRRAVSDLTLDKMILAEAARGTISPRQRNF